MKINDVLVEANADVGAAGNFAAGFFNGIGDRETADIIKSKDSPGKKYSKTDAADLAKQVQNKWALRQKNLDKRSLQDLGTYQAELDKVIGEELGGYAPTNSLRDMSAKAVHDYIETAIDEYDSQQANEAQQPGQAPAGAPQQGAAPQRGSAPQQSLFNPIDSLNASYAQWKKWQPTPGEKQKVHTILTQIAGGGPKAESRIITRGKTITNEELKRFPSQRRKIYEGLTKSEIKRVVLWEGIGRKLTEANLNAQQIDQVFQQVEQELTAGGAGISSNRTFIGKGKDLYDTVEKAVTDLGKAAQNTALVKGFDNLYDAAAAKLKTATGGDEGLMQYIQKYRDFAKAHPALQNLFYTTLIIGTGLATGGASGPVIAGVFKAVDRMLQGDKLSSALAKGTTTGIKSALVQGAKNLASDAVANATSVDVSAEPPPVHTGSVGDGEVDPETGMTPDEELAQGDANAARLNANPDLQPPVQPTPGAHMRPGPVLDQPPQGAANIPPDSQVAPQTPAVSGPSFWDPSNPTQFKFTPDQQKWLGGADAHDPYIISRMPDNLGPKPPLEYFDPNDMTAGMKQVFKPAAQMNYGASSIPPQGMPPPPPQGMPQGYPPGYGPAPQQMPRFSRPEFMDPQGMIPGDQYRPGYGRVNQPWQARGTYNAMEPTAPIMDPHSPYATPRAGTTGPRYRDPRNFFQDKWSDGYVAAGIALTETQVSQIFYKIELRERASALVQEGVWDTIKKGLIDPAEKKVKQFGKNLTTKITADKLQKAWDKSAMPTDPEGLIDFLVQQKVNRAVAEKVVGQFANGQAPGAAQPGGVQTPQNAANGGVQSAQGGGVPWGSPTGQGQSGQQAQGGAAEFNSETLGAEWQKMNGQASPEVVQAVQGILTDPWWGGQGQPANNIQFPEPAPTAPPVPAPGQPGQPSGQPADQAQAAPEQPQGRFAAADKVTKKQDYYAANRKANDAAAKAAKAQAKMPTQNSANPTSPANGPKKESKIMQAMLKDFVSSLNK